MIRGMKDLCVRVKRCSCCRTLVPAEVIEVCCGHGICPKCKRRQRRLRKRIAGGTWHKENGDDRHA